MNFQEELQILLNRYSKENASNTPDFILAEYILMCLNAFNIATIERNAWYNIEYKNKVLEKPLENDYNYISEQKKKNNPLENVKTTDITEICK